MRDTEQERQELDRRLTEITTKLDYLGIKGIEREREWQQLHQQTRHLVTTQFLIVIAVITVCGYYFAAN